MEMADLRDAKKLELMESRQKQWDIQKELDEFQDVNRTLKRKLTEALEEKQRLKTKVERMQKALEFERSGRQNVENERQKFRGEIEALHQQMAAHQQDTRTSAMAQKLLQVISTPSLWDGAHSLADSPSKQVEDLIEAREQKLNREFEERDKERERLYQEAMAQLRQEREQLRQNEIDRQAKGVERRCYWQAKGEESEALLLARDKELQDTHMRIRELIEVGEYRQNHTFVRSPSCKHVPM
jgi:hypothetical protein